MKRHTVSERAAEEAGRNVPESAHSPCRQGKLEVEPAKNDAALRSECAAWPVLDRCSRNSSRPGNGRHDSTVCGVGSKRFSNSLGRARTRHQRIVGRAHRQQHNVADSGPNGTSTVAGQTRVLDANPVMSNMSSSVLIAGNSIGRRTLWPLWAVQT